MKKCFLIPLLAIALSFNAISKVPQNDIDLRSKEIGKSLRCVVCQNQSIEDSDAPLAADMRQIVKKRILEGDTNDEIINYMRRQYGDFVLLKPPFQKNTLALWILPFMLIVASGVWFFKAKK